MTTRASAKGQGDKITKLDESESVMSRQWRQHEGARENTCPQLISGKGHGNR